MQKAASSKGSSQAQGSSSHDQSLIYQILTHKQPIPATQPLSQPNKQSTSRHTTEQKGEGDDYGELLEVQALSLAVGEEGLSPEMERVEEQNKIKVFIDPNPRHQACKRTKNKSPPAIEVLQSNPIPANYATIPKQRSIESPPMRKETALFSHRQRTGSSVSRRSSVASEIDDSFEEYKEFKRRKKSQSMKALVRKMEGLQKKVEKLKLKNRQLQQRQQRKRFFEEKASGSQAQLFSNLISIKVQGNDHLKQDILQQLRNIRHKVDVLDNKSTEARQNAPYSTMQMQPLENFTAGIAESKVQLNSHINYSQSRNKPTGKILRRSQAKVPASGNEQPLNILHSDLIKEGTSRKEDIKKVQPIVKDFEEKVQGTQVEKNTTNNKNTPQQQSKEKIQRKQESNGQQEQIEVKPEQRIARDAITLTKPKKKTEEVESPQNFKRMEDCRQSPIQETKPAPRGMSQGGFVRSGGQKIPPISAVDRDDSREEWSEPLKMLEFDTDKQKFMVESNPTQEQNRSLLRIRQVNSWEEAQTLLPLMPDVTGVASFESSNEELQQLGKQLLERLGAGQIDYDQIGLKIKKYKNCVYFGVDSERNILLHYEGRLYYGGWREYLNGEGQKSGQGIEMSPNKFTYKGHYKQGKRNGLGVIKIKATTGKEVLYVGQFIDGNKHGDGRQFQQNGPIYIGQWKDNKKDGRGKLIISRHQMYHGTFQKGFKSGYGQQTFTNGDRYQGQYQLGKFQGKGKYLWGSGAIYEGYFRAGRRNGWGVWRSQSEGGDVYEGEYVDDKKEGQGTYTWANGAVYKGYFKQDQKHGKGTITHQNGQVTALQWQNGEVIKHFDPNEQPHSRPSADPNHMMLTNTKIRNHSKSLPVNKKFLTSRQKQRNHNDNKLLAQNVFNKLTLSNASNSGPKGVTNMKIHRGENHRKIERECRVEREVERPVTSKSLSSVNSNFKLERRGGAVNKEAGRQVTKDGFPVDPPYRGIRPSANIVHF